mgnify:CR=1 FL=1
METRNLFAEAQKIIPGGVNSPVRAFRAVGGTPRFIREAAGSKIIDTEGREYIDYVASWGPMILGHSHPDVVAAIREAAGRGFNKSSISAGAWTSTSVPPSLSPSFFGSGVPLYPAVATISPSRCRECD